MKATYEWYAPLCFPQKVRNQLGAHKEWPYCEKEREREVEMEWETDNEKKIDRERQAEKEQYIKLNKSSWLNKVTIFSSTLIYFALLHSGWLSLIIFVSNLSTYPHTPHIRSFPIISMICKNLVISSNIIIII